MRTRRWIIVASVVVLLAGTAAYLMTPNLTSGHIPGPETTAVTSLRALGTANGTFKRSDWYGTGKGVYARDPRHLYEIGSGKTPRLIGPSLVAAFGSDRNGTGAVPRAGYIFFDISPHRNCKAAGTPAAGFAYCAVPAEYNVTGRQTFVMDIGGSVYGRDMGGRLVLEFPKNLEGWAASGD